MKIDEAIKMLEEAKAKGTKSIVFAFWESSLFGREDDADWELLTEEIESDMDWSDSNDQMSEIIEESESDSEE